MLRFSLQLQIDMIYRHDIANVTIYFRYHENSLQANFADAEAIANGYSRFNASRGKLF